ncbi:MAG: hypothetical protein JOY62_18695 [Acidobacteriaceae bacterium]|nr:hypothetical protein [Acidobacteriaceae bacterium]
MAAKMIVEGRAVLASEEEKELYRSKQANARQAAEKAELARRVQVAIINDSEIKHHIAAQLEDPCTTGE